MNTLSDIICQIYERLDSESDEIKIRIEDLYVDVKKFRDNALKHWRGSKIFGKNEIALNEKITVITRLEVRFKKWIKLVGIENYTLFCQFIPAFRPTPADFF